MSRSTVLIIEDDRVLRRILGDYLETEGHQVVKAETGESGLKRVGPHVDVVILDQDLPDADGISLLGAIRERLRRGEIIVVTAHPRGESRRRAFRSGASEYLEKPIPLAYLAALVDEAVETGNSDR